MTTSFNYNCDTPLWTSYRQSKPKTELHIRNGHIIDTAQNDVTARFDDDTAARDCLLAAGWTETRPFVFVP